MWNLRNKTNEQRKKKRQAKKKKQLFFKKIFYLFILTERERQPAREGTQAGGVGEKEAGSQWKSLMRGSIPKLWDHALNQRQTLND